MIKISKKVSGKISLIFLFLLALGMLWVSIFPESGNQTAALLSLEAPFHSTWMGRDSLGRDLFLRILQGAEVSLGLGVSSSMASLLLGMCYGALASMGPKKLESVLMRFLEVLMALPTLMVMAVLTLILQSQSQNQFLNLFLVLTLASWMPVARLTRNLIRQERSQDYVQSARAVGASPKRIFVRHLLPNLMSPLLVFWSLQIPHAILAEGLLSFLGFGVKSPSVSWGALLQEGWKSLSVYPHLLFAPALVLFLTVLSINILLETVRKSQDPKLKWEKYS